MLWRPAVLGESKIAELLSRVRDGTGAFKFLVFGNNFRYSVNVMVPS